MGRQAPGGGPDTASELPAAPSQVFVDRFGPGAGVTAWLSTIGAVVPVVLLGVLLAGEPGSVAPSVYVLGVGIPAALAAVMAAFVRRNSIRITPERVEISSSFYRYTSPLASIAPATLTRFDLRRDRRWHPRFRTNGVAMPGYRSGWFRLVDNRRAFLALAGSTGLAFVTRDGVAVMVSGSDIDAVEREIQRRLAPPSGGGD